VSGEEGAPEPEPAPLPPPAPFVPAYEDRPANFMGGAFLIGCGACLLFVGGVCTSLWWVGTHAADRLFDMAIMAGGIFAIVQGVRMAKGRRG
jgi:hypothetical protein